VPDAAGPPCRRLDVASSETPEMSPPKNCGALAFTASSPLHHLRRLGPSPPRRGSGNGGGAPKEDIWPAAWFVSPCRSSGATRGRLDFRLSVHLIQLDIRYYKIHITSCLQSQESPGQEESMMFLRVFFLITCIWFDRFCSICKAKVKPISRVEERTHERINKYQ
jgi:hypothetical protein